VAIALAATAASTSAQDVVSMEAIVTTHHQVSVGGRVLRYTARAGHIPIRDNEAGEVHANMFFVAYTLDQASGAKPRPLTFLWNGGPGSNSGLVQLLGFGPKRITAATGKMPPYSPSGTALVDNQETWLLYSDLVFIDPIGTGYSRPTKAEYATEFYQGPGDAESVAEFIRVYRLRNDAFDSPLYLMGESYGVTRASLVSEALERRRTRVAGVVLLSGGFPVPNDVSAPVRAALTLPAYTAAAHYNKKLRDDLQRGSINDAVRAAQAYAEGDYARALARIDSLSPVERDAVAAQLERFTGLPASQIDKRTLRVSIELMSNGLLSSAGQMVGRYDSRLVGPRDTTQGPYDPTTDPSLKDILDAISVTHYLREELGFKSDLFYQGPFGGGYPPPTTFRGDWMSTRWGRGAAPPAGPSGRGGSAGGGARGGGGDGGRGGPTAPTAQPQGLGAALETDPRLRVFVACGYFDLNAGCFASEYAARHLPPSLANRVMARVYGGGHATYTDDNARRQLQADFAKFVQQGGTK
jgi:carboxypeptidase C (cathepsin A)